MFKRIGGGGVKTIKVKSCDSCFFASTEGEHDTIWVRCTLSEPNEYIHFTERREHRNVGKSCPLKKEPIKIELEAGE